jgi:3-hydroxyanthranilate 3,4-dioxygenase
MLSYGMPRNLNAWIDQVRDKLRPPVGNQQIWENADLITTVVGSPNERTDFHDDPYEEFFYQIKGNAFVLILDRGKFARVDLREGDVFLLPAHVRHSPQRPGNDTLCVVIERARPIGTLDSSGTAPAAHRWCTGSSASSSASSATCRNYIASSMTPARRPAPAGIAARSIAVATQKRGSTPL